MAAVHADDNRRPPCTVFRLSVRKKYSQNFAVCAVSRRQPEPLKIRISWKNFKLRHAIIPYPCPLDRRILSDIFSHYQQQNIHKFMINLRYFIGLHPRYSSIFA